MGRTDFTEIARTTDLPALVVRDGTRLHKNGPEHIGLCPFHVEKTPSFTLYQNRSGSWKFYCFGCDTHGDSIDYVQARHGCLSVSEAAGILTGRSAPAPQPVSLRPAAPPDEHAFGLPPADAPPIVAGIETPAILNPRRTDPRTGKSPSVRYTPTAVYTYRTAEGHTVGHVLRIEFDGRKITPGVWWMSSAETGFSGWSHGSGPMPRPIYGLERIAPDRQILIVEGEKCADAAARLLDGQPIVPVSWAGGGRAFGKTDWSPLKNFSVMIWPDNDGPGRNCIFGTVDERGDWKPGLAEHLLAVGVKRLKIIDISPNERPEGWDIADAETEGMDKAGLSAFILPRISEWTESSLKKFRTSKMSAVPGPDDTGQQQEGWRAELEMTARGNIKSNVKNNGRLFLTYDSDLAGLFGWNELALKIFVTRRPAWDERTGTWAQRPFTESDVTEATCWLETLGIRLAFSTVGQLIEAVSRKFAFNPVVEALRNLVWDGVPRLSGGVTEHGEVIEPAIVEYWGADDTPINRIFLRRWLIGSVARSMAPGTKNDTMLILEGAQGTGKSTSLRILAEALGPGLFVDEISDPNSKDAAMQIQGAVICEISELDSFRKSASSQIKSWLSRSTDHYRRPYGRLVEDFPRTCVLAGTVNPSGAGYLHDPSGGRRFWPIVVGRIDIDRLSRDAPQLWAEACAAWRAGEHWYLDDPAEHRQAAEVQELRYEQDPYGDIIDKFLTNQTETTVSEIFEQALDASPDRRTPAMQNRIVSHLKKRGWIESRETVGNAISIIYRRGEDR